MTVDADGLRARLEATVEGEVRLDAGARHLYATDASHYRQVPVGVVVPRSKADVVATVGVCHDLDVPILPRGAGTSLAGQATNAAVVLDVSRHLTTIEDLDPERRRAVVQPGVVLDDLRAAAAPHDLTFGPDPSTHNRCTLGGMIGNNACGVHSVTAGRTADNVVSMEVLLADGTRLHVGGDAGGLESSADAGGRRGEIHRDLRAIRERYAPLIRERFPPIPRRVSGYNLDELLPERGGNVARTLVGSEGTCAITLAATVCLVPRPAARAMLVLGYPSLPAAGAHVPTLLESEPIGLEGIDREVAAGARRRGTLSGTGLPAGDAWLLVEFDGASAGEAEARAVSVADGLSGPAVEVVTDPSRQQRLWGVRKTGLGATTFPPDGPARWPGWEDAAVPPGRLGDYLRDFEGLLEEHDLDAAIYGHFGDGCVHAKIGFDHASSTGIAAYRRFVEAAADLVVSYGGSLSGEHGDGQSRGELLERMYGPEMIEAFRAFKAVWDPDGRMNPGKLVDPAPLDSHLRLGPDHRPREPATEFTYQDDGGRFSQAALRCVGVGACRRDDGAGTMCPSYMVTHEEQHSTRGRARLLFEMLRPDSDLDGWNDEHVHDALELCLSCKGCKVDCPVGVDMATYKAEFMAHHYDGRRRPRAHHALGRIHRWARLATVAPGTANLLLGLPGVGPLLRRMGGVTTERPAPQFATQTFRSWWRTQAPPDPGGDRDVLLFVDTFTDRFHPEVGRAAVAVLTDAGYRVRIPDEVLCCGRPLYDHGMLSEARPLLRRLVDVLSPAAARGVPVVGLEPSCVAVFRDELPNLLGHDPDVEQVSRGMRTLAEVLVESPYEPPRLERRALMHGHCQQKAVGGLTAEGRLLDAMGLDWEELDAGCCGLAGSFGFEAGEKFEVSVRAGERKLLPAVRAADPETLVVADGFSCQTQIDHLQQMHGAGVAGDRRALHLAELLRLAAETGPEGPDATPVEAASPHGDDGGFAPRELAGGALLAAGAVVWLLRWLRRRGVGS